MKRPNLSSNSAMRPKGLSSKVATSGGGEKANSISGKPFFFAFPILLTSSSVPFVTALPPTAFTHAPTGMRSRSACVPSPIPCATQSLLKNMPNGCDKSTYTNVKRNSDLIPSSVDRASARGADLPLLGSEGCDSDAAEGEAPFLNLSGTVLWNFSMAFPASIRLAIRTKQMAPQSAHFNFWLMTVPTWEKIAAMSSSVTVPGKPLTYRLSVGAGFSPLPWYLTVIGFASLPSGAAAVPAFSSSFRCCTFSLATSSLCSRSACDGGFSSTSSFGANADLYFSCNGASSSTSLPHLLFRTRSPPTESEGGDEVAGPQIRRRASTLSLAASRDP
mmetsp:Transcript_2749/g.10833  ORF Transcript_2749/g.10833 Transcript_2749/m.10833 type:complete len:332 (+) Transcript_2749:2872-3867(+)